MCVLEPRTHFFPFFVYSNEWIRRIMFESLFKFKAFCFCSRRYELNEKNLLIITIEILKKIHFKNQSIKSIIWKVRVGESESQKLFTFIYYIVDVNLFLLLLFSSWCSNHFGYILFVSISSMNDWLDLMLFSHQKMIVKIQLKQARERETHQILNTLLIDKNDNRICEKFVFVSKTLFQELKEYRKNIHC